MQEFALELAFPDARATAGLQRVVAKFRPAATETLAEGMPAIGIPGFVPWQNKMPNYFFATITLKVRKLRAGLRRNCAHAGSAVCTIPT